MNLQFLRWLCGLQDLLVDELEGNFLRVHTRIRRGGKSFRAHPNCRGKGPWRDWVWVDYGPDGMFPCHIWAFVVVPPMDDAKRLHYGGTPLEEGVFACVESADVVKNERDGLKKLEMMHPIEKTVGLDDEGEVLLTKKGNVAKRHFYLADTNAFVDPCCVIPDIGGPKNRYYLIESRENWSNIFSRWLDTPLDDDMVIEEDLSEDEETEGDSEGTGDQENHENPQDMEESGRVGGESSSDEG